MSDFIVSTETELIEAETTVYEVVEGATTVYEVVEVGIQGPPGASGSAVSVVASQPIGGHRLIRLDGSATSYADARTLADASCVLGMTRGAAAVGGTLDVVRSGEISEPSWSWVADTPVFLGQDGLPTQVLPPTAVFSLVVGFPISPTKLFISIGTPIVLT